MIKVPIDSVSGDSLLSVSRMANPHMAKGLKTGMNVVLSLGGKDERCQMCPSKFMHWEGIAECKQCWMVGLMKDTQVMRAEPS
jgi:hypothetical protein